MHLYLLFSLPPKSLSLASMNDPVAREAIQLDCFAWPFPLLLKFVVWKVLRRGLGKRVKLVATRLHYQQKVFCVCVCVCAYTHLYMYL